MRLALFLLLVSAVQAASLYTVLPTGSMLPTFNQDYYLFVERPPFATLKVGNIIVYRSAKVFVYEGVEYNLIVHRIWRRSSGGRVLLLRGDSNQVPDSELVVESMYVGMVTAYVRKDVYYEPGSVIVLDKQGQVGQR